MAAQEIDDGVKPLFEQGHQGLLEEPSTWTGLILATSVMAVSLSQSFRLTSAQMISRTLLLRAKSRRAALPACPGR